MPESLHRNLGFASRLGEEWLPRQSGRADTLHKRIDWSGVETVTHPCVELVDFKWLEPFACTLFRARDLTMSGFGGEMNDHALDFTAWLRVVVQTALGVSLTEAGYDLECKETLSDSDPDEVFACQERLEEEPKCVAVRSDDSDDSPYASASTPDSVQLSSDGPATPSVQTCSPQLPAEEGDMEESPSLIPEFFTVRRRRSVLSRRPSARTPVKRTPKRTKASSTPRKRKGYPVTSGEELNKLIARIMDEPMDFEPGTRVWIKSPSFCDWPGVIWSLKATARTDWPDILKAYAKGSTLVLFYGDRTHMWAPLSQISEFRSMKSSRISKLEKWGQKNGQRKIIDLTTMDLENSLPNPTKELERMQEGSVSRFTNICDACGESGSELSCAYCKLRFHPICLSPPVLEKAKLLEQKGWRCSGCGYKSKGEEVRQIVEPPTQEPQEERTGLTPDWVIQAAAFSVFQLPKPTEEYPYIRGLLDPCTNSKVTPNIPAEKLYDKADNGLKLCNSWSGYHVLLNPDYKSQVQWRFVNRAIDEVENGNVPAVILISRNSTDTGYYQRLRPYPRVLLRRQSIKFKNYDHTPIGFGIVVFCIARKQDCQNLFQRFIEAFSPYGEPNMAVDEELLSTPEFPVLLDRLREHAAVHQRDHWIQCSTCSKWRIIPYDTIQEFKDQEWTCKDLRPGSSSCRTPQTKAELKGVHYAVGVKDDANPEIDGLQWSESDPSKKLDTDSEMGTPLKTHLSSEQRPDDASAKSTQQPMGEIACGATLHRLATIPPRSNASSMLGVDNTGVQGNQGNPVLTCLELARQAREAANRAYLKGLGKDPSAIHQGELDFVPPWDDLTISAAVLVKKKAESAEAQLVVQQAQRQFEAKRRKRQIEEGHLKKTHEQLKREEKESFAALEVATCAIEEISQENIW
ncbi:hypothetical protein BSKO_01069 [Bryopsis sp. KO-2023]|nr:hypothetical protein BSKO_01069 [Bryopsis sp. KO-2023]